MAKEAVEPLAAAIVETGRAVFSINYRLLDDAPWPACHEDVLAAARFILGGGLGQYADLSGKLTITGASAGGHLALMTGLALGSECVEAILSLAGPARVDRAFGTCDSFLFSDTFLILFFGQSTPSADEIRAASPLAHLTPQAPPLFCFHSTQDQLVPPAHSRALVAAWRALGLTAELHLFEGRDHLHGFWDSDALTLRRPVPACRLWLHETFAHPAGCV